MCGVQALPGSEGSGQEAFPGTFQITLTNKQTKEQTEQKPHTISTYSSCNMMPFIIMFSLSCRNTLCSWFPLLPSCSPAPQLPPSSQMSLLLSDHTTALLIQIQHTRGNVQSFSFEPVLLHCAKLRFYPFSCSDVLLFFFTTERNSTEELGKWLGW